jgi:uncharacterized protein
MRIFLDANILFSAADPSSATRMLFNAARSNAEIVTTPHAWEEARRNLVLKRPKHAAGLKELQNHLVMSHAFSPIEATGLPDFDIPIISGAAGSASSHLWTSDKRHFGKWYGKELHDVTVVSSVMLAELLMKKGWKPH